MKETKKVDYSLSISIEQIDKQKWEARTRVLGGATSDFFYFVVESETYSQVIETVCIELIEKLQSLENKITGI